MIIYYNPECSKCHQALQLLQDNHCNYEVRNYLQEPPTVNELKELTKLLNCSPFDLVRKKEALYIEKYEGKKLNDEQMFEILSANPLLIERPILINGTEAIIGRPPELVLQIIKKI